MNTRTACRAAAVLFAAAIMATAANAQAAVVINEYWADDSSTDTSEYIELFNNGGSAVDLSQWSVIVVDGDTGGSTSSPNYKLLNLRVDLTDAGSLAAGGYYLIGAGLAPNPNKTFTLGQLQNGTITIALVRTVDLAFDNPPTNTILSDASVAAITANLVDGVATQNGLTADHIYFGATNLGSNSMSADSTSHAWDTASRIPNGQDTNQASDWVKQDNYGVYIELGDANDALASPGAMNGNPSAKWGACCDGTTCTYVQPANCASPKVYKHNWRDCFALYNPCVGPACVNIAQARAMPFYSPVKLCDVKVAYTVDTIYSTNSATFMVQDSSGSPNPDRGLMIYGRTTTLNAMLSGAPVGKKIDVVGMTNPYNGVLELIDDPTAYLERMRVSSDPAAPPALVTATCGDFSPGNPRAEELESVRIKIGCVAFADHQNLNFAGATNYVITDGADWATIRTTSDSAAPQDTKIDGNNPYTPVPSGVVSVNLLVNQYSTGEPYEDGYQLYLTEKADLGTATCGSTGNCCFPSAPTTRVLTQSICTMLGGVWAGAGSCGTWVTTGACCAPNNSCTDGMTLANCIAAGGAFRGEGSTCAVQGCADLMTVAQAKAATIGKYRTLRDVTITCKVDMVQSTSSYAYYAQDDSGARGSPRGICIYGSSATDPFGSYAEGDRIMVSGTTYASAGLYELDGYDLPDIKVWQKYSSGNSVTPTVIGAADLQDGSPTAEALESTLVTLRCVKFNATGLFAAQTNYSVTDGTYTAWIRISTSANTLVNTAIPTGPVNITGLFTQNDLTYPYDGYYSILPRRVADIVAAENCDNFCNTCTGDFNGDGFVNATDLSLLNTYFIPALLGTATEPKPCADVNEDGMIDGLDIGAFVAKVLDNGGAGTECNPCVGCINVSRCDAPTNTCPTNGLNMFCSYAVVDNLETQAMLAGRTRCVGTNGLLDGDMVCVLCDNPSEPCPANNGDDYQIFKWKDGVAPGLDCYFVGARISGACFDCIGSSQYRFRVTP